MPEGNAWEPPTSTTATNNGQFSANNSLVSDSVNENRPTSAPAFTNFQTASGASHFSEKPNNIDLAEARREQNSLISLSPDNTLRQNQTPNNIFSSDLEGIDFTTSAENNSDTAKEASGQSDSPEKGSPTKNYQEFRHVFCDTAGGKEKSSLPKSETYPQTSGNTGLQYGWNSNLFNNDPWKPFGATAVDVRASGPGHTASGQPTGLWPTGPFPHQAFGQNSGFAAPGAQFGSSLSLTSNPFSNVAPTLPVRSCSTFSDADFNTVVLPPTSTGVHGNSVNLSQSSTNASHLQNLFELDNISQWERDLSEGKSNSEKSNDLMDFSPSEEMEYLSLDSFDPLYERTRRESFTSKDKVPSYLIGDISAREVTPGLRQLSEDQMGRRQRSSGGSLYPVEQLQAARVSSDIQAGEEDLEKFLQSTATESEKTSQVEPPPRPPPIKSSTKLYETLRKRLFVDDESHAFCQMVADLKSKYKSTDEDCNLGFVVSPMCDKQQPSLSVKIVIYSDFASDPVLFTCDVHTLVEHIVCNALYNHLTDVSNSFCSKDFILKVSDRSEYLLNDQELSKYEYVHECLKLDQDIRFTLMRRQDVFLPFLRTVDDDAQNLVFPKDYIKTDEAVVTRGQLEILINIFYTQVEKLRDHVLKNETNEIRFRSLQQSVKAVCMTLAKIETIDITKTLRRAEGIVQQFVSQETRQNYDNEVKMKGSDQDTQVAFHMAIRCSLIEELEEVLDQLLVTVKQLIKMYCHTFHTDYLLGTAVQPVRETNPVVALEDNFILHIATVHRIPVTWSQKYDEYKIICSLHYGKDKIDLDVVTSCKTITTTQLCGLECILWDEWVSFDEIPVQVLPRETRVCMTLCGVKVVPSSNQNNTQGTKVLSPLGGVTVQLYNQSGNLISGNLLVPLKMYSVADPFIPFCSSLQSDAALIHINLPDFGKQIVFPDVYIQKSCEKKQFSSLLPEIQKIARDTMEKDCVSSCQADELEILWRYRNYLHDFPDALPWILQGVVRWDWASLSDVYSLLQSWGGIDPMQALELLLPQYPDNKVRKFAVDCLKKMATDDLIEFIPQLIQALKYESYHASDLSRLLLEQSCKSIRFAHKFFWLLKGAAQDSTYKHRYELMFVALVSVAGDALYQEFRKQEELVKILTNAAEKVQVSKEKDGTLKREMQAVFELFEDRGSILLPYNPGLAVSGVDLKSCSYFTSNALPLKLVFKSTNIKAEPIYVMFKVGDDLRQDMLTMQMVKIMDRLWLRAGLDLKMITFACLATGPKRGVIELVMESDTLRRIQVSYGVTGSFKDRPIKEWLQKHNPTELEYQKALENFTSSCAGYCVATYVLGICDRHNDNIMLKQSGHMFHIDFNKFLGDSQMFGNIRRDRVPFVLTSDMAFVINNGEKRSDRFQNFIDQCCQAFNILRKNANLFLNLFALMTRAGIPGVSENAALYIQKALLPKLTDAQASAIFTRMIEDSLKSVFTPINFFIHNLAQLKFSSHQEGALLSFVPKTYSANTDGKLKHVSLHSYQKRYEPDKHYIFIFKVERESQKLPTYVFRHYSELVEFRTRIVELFPLVSWPPLPSRLVIGRSQVKSVAESRKPEIEKFLAELWQKTAEIKESDLVYTFFHTLLRDEQESQIEKLDTQKRRVNPVQLIQHPNQFGQLKLSLLYSKESLMVNIMHARNLPGTPVPPSPYVKTYVLPDPEKQTKQKTKIVKSSTHPTYNEVIEYKMALSDLQHRTLQVSVWDHDIMKENSCLGAIYIKLRSQNLTTETVNWFQLHNIQITDSSTLA
ncbi:Phosphatidylinositol 4-phosphate 3-kinase C2 domain-containing subunit alpha [Mizuhopecten yessoensis]|uniref:Phosphatidylinositol 4-phosphate 3-kinase C2 domain-containing subunit alpha n=2 Tax=Mizuhopecten yessoensis TaxID=6573 RepID=A0A210PJ75_MIZYE|nr:Phosphatidylinositol 4-phosphate 3-kinase C2 domain-containing subunit alpha [Mizuhopecten yessoensis]